MAATTLDQLRKGTKVVATADLRGVPEGTPGKVMMVAGLTWIRYWVRFDNGVSLGSISRDKLATKADLARGPVDETADDADEATGAGADAGGDDAGGGKATPSGTLVPQKLLDRSAAARVRLGA
ncbi:MAG: hypothetical protein KDA94_10810 [Acidimicrobiales bacterium]|nr:hypothetical protein [Acidimicrobiales bacterium]